MSSSGISKIASQLKEGSLRATELCHSSLARIRRTKDLNCFITVTHDVAEEQSKRSERRHKTRTQLSPLDGVTIAVKDNFCTKGIKTTCASRMLESFVPPYNATVVDKLLGLGAVLVGKTNMDEFAMGSGTVDSIFGPTRNIWRSGLSYSVSGEKVDSENSSWRIAGGSSGGSAVAVAAGVAFAALGSDTGGSTRNPASYCGVVGFKPTYSSVSRYGLIPLVNSMDVPGILTRNVEDAALIYNCISGHDTKDSTTVTDIPPVRLAPFNSKSLRVGLPKEYFSDHLSPAIREACDLVVELLSKEGTQIIPLTMPHTKYSISCYSVLNQCEVASNMARYDGLRYGHRVLEDSSMNKLFSSNRREGFNQVVRERILAGNYFLLKRNFRQYFEKALRVRRLILEDFLKAWERVDVLLTPTTLTEAPVFSEYVKMNNREQCSAHDFCTQPVNMTGCPAVSVPICLSKNGLPLSVQLIAKNFGEEKLLSVARWIEQRASFPSLELD